MVTVIPGYSALDKILQLTERLLTLLLAGMIPLHAAAELVLAFRIGHPQYLKKRRGTVIAGKHISLARMIFQILPENYRRTLNSSLFPDNMPDLEESIFMPSLDTLEKLLLIQSGKLAINPSRFIFPPLLPVHL